MKSSSTLLGLTGLAIPLLLSACGQPQGSEDASQDAGVVNVFSARHYASDDAVYAAFTEETGIEVNVIEAGGDLLVGGQHGAVWVHGEGERAEEIGSLSGNTIQAMAWIDGEIWAGGSSGLRVLARDEGRDDWRVSATLLGGVHAPGAVGTCQAALRLDGPAWWRGANICAGTGGGGGAAVVGANAKLGALEWLRPRLPLEATGA